VLSKIWKPIFFIVGFALIIALSVFWIVSIISFFMAKPYVNYFFAGSQFLSYVGIINVLSLFGVPLLGIILWLSKYVFKTRVTPNFKAGMWSFWVVNVISLFALGSYQSAQFRGHVELNRAVDLSSVQTDTLSVRVDPDPHRGASFSFGDLKISNERLVSRHIHLNIVKGEEDQYELVQEIYSRGASESNARSLAESVAYDIQVTDNTVIFPRVMEFGTGDQWRNQQVELTLKVPEGKYIHFQNSPQVLTYHVQIDREQEYPQMAADQTWIMEAGGLVNKDFVSRSQRSEEFKYTDFNSLQLDGHMKVSVEKGDKFKITMSGKPHFLDKVEVVQLDKTLNISFDRDPYYVSSPVRISIIMPELKSLNSNNTDDVKIQGFTQSSMHIKHDGEDELHLVAKIDSLFLLQDNRSEITLKGSGNYLEAILDRYTDLDADQFSVKKAKMEMGVSTRAKIAVSDSIWTNQPGSARLEVDGDPVVIERNQENPNQ
jgi:hypothetical protein